MKIFNKIAIAFIFIIFIGLPVSAKDDPVPIPEQNEQPDKTQLYASCASRKYVLGPNDIIKVDVLGVEEFSRESVKVHPDGKINLSGLGSIYATGLTFDELGSLIEEKYSRYVRNPKVVISLERSRPFIVQVTGAVSMPGSYEIKTDTETITDFHDDDSTYVERKTPILSNVLTAAGGVSYDADVEHILITNRFDNTKHEVNLLNLLENGNAEQDMYLVAGDTVNVPALPSPLAVNSEKYERFRAATFAYKEVPVRVLGYVNNPGLITLDSSVSSGLNTAISEAGGYRGDSPYPPKKVFVSRYSNGGKLVTTVVDPMQKDITLLPNDVVYVPEKTRPIIGRAFDFIMRIADPVGCVASGYNHWSLMFDPGRFN